MRTLEVHVVLVGSGHARERTDLRRVGTRCDSGIDLVGGCEGKLLGRLEERVHFAVARRDAGERLLGDFARRELACGETGLDLADAHGGELVGCCH